MEKLIKPILFNTDMTVAILKDRKTVTRRLIKPQLSEECPVCKYCHNEYIYDVNAQNIYCARCGEPLRPEKSAPYQPGDILYVRETWERFECCCCEGDEHSGICINKPDEKGGCYMYRATNEIGGDARWHPSIHMPKEAARIFLKVKDVRVKRLQDMISEDMEKEGLENCCRKCSSLFSECDTCMNDGGIAEEFRY